MPNTLYYGDNLDVLKRHIDDASVDLVYLDPPFQSGRDYNILFEEQDGTRATAQIQAFEDTWTWDQRSVLAFDQVVSAGGHLASVMEAFRHLLGGTPMLAYVSMMAPRLVELRRVLRPTGSIFLHCDPTASAHLRLLMDAIFGTENFRNEIIWQRTTPKGHAFTRFPSTHDILLCYGRSEATTWNAQYIPHRQEYIESHYGNVEPSTNRQYMLDNCLNPNPDRPNLTYEWNGLTRVWRWKKERMQILHDEGRLVYTKSGMPRYKRYLDEMPGTPITSVWTDIPPINSQAAERLGYPTQKPVALLERIIKSSSNEGETVLDPFCGCGTTIHAAQSVNRQWIGIDVTHLAIGLIKHRLLHTFGLKQLKDYQVVGEPTTIEGAQQLALDDRHQFEHWALGLVGARSSAKRKGADKGIDGQLSFQEGGPGSEHKRVLISVKSGGVNSGDVRDLRGVVEREKAAMGLLITLERSSRDKVLKRPKTQACLQTFGWRYETGRPAKFVRVSTTGASYPVEAEAA